jgi:hypothetical protein
MSGNEPLRRGSLRKVMHQMWMCGYLFAQVPAYYPGLPGTGSGRINPLMTSSASAQRHSQTYATPR